MQTDPIDDTVSKTFDVTIDLSDPCPTATLATQPTFVDPWDFVVSDDAETRNLEDDYGNKITLDPSFCPFTLSISTDDDSDKFDSNLSINDDGTDQTITIAKFVDNTLDVIGGKTQPSQNKEATIGISVNSPFNGDGVKTIDDQITFTINLQNPCYSTKTASISDLP